MNLSTPEQVAEAFEIAAQVSREVIVEEMFRGLDYRVVVVNCQWSLLHSEFRRTFGVMVLTAFGS